MNHELTKLRRVVVKIGSNVLTRHDGSLDITRLSAIVDQCAALRGAGIEVIIITSGAVASGRSELRGRVSAADLDPVSARQLFSAVGQTKLINRYYELFREHDIACGQVLTAKENLATRHHYLNQRHCMMTMLSHGVVPIVNENDTVSLTELMFTDNDELSGLIATMMDADALVILSNIDGIYTGNPDQPDSELIEVIQPDDDLTAFISSSRSSAGRGGMATKYRIARRVASEGITVVIANGKRPDILTALLIKGNAPCSRFVPAEVSPSSVKRWVAHADGFSKGVLTVNDGASEALRAAPGISLLPVGVTGVEGDFTRGDIVTIAEADGTVIGWGVAERDSDVLAQEAGMRNGTPAIHADYLFIN